MMIMAVLPDINQHYLAQGDFEFMRLCRYYELRNKLPLGSVQYPFPIFFDNARIHAHARLSMASVWQYTPCGLPRQRSVQAKLAAQSGTAAQLAAAMQQRERDALPELQRSSEHHLRAKAYATLQSQPQHQKLALRELAVASREQRQLSADDARCAGFPPQMCGPLVDKTPDINAPAENCVGFLKAAVTKRVRNLMWNEQYAPQLDWARTYEMALREEVQKLNTPDGLLTCKGSVLKSPARVKLLAAEEKQLVLVQQVSLRKGKEGQRELVTYERYELGRNGRWMARGVFKG